MPLYCKLHKASLIAILLSISPLLVLGQLPSDAEKSYLSNDSYSQYPPWIPESQGLLVFTFRTTQPNCLLVYMDSGQPGLGQFFKLSLVQGVLEARVFGLSFKSEQFTTGEGLNNNENHTISIELNTVASQFTMTLDDLQPEMFSYHPFFPHIGIGGLYFSGIPNNIDVVSESLVRDDENFNGCLMNVRYSNDSTSESDLMAVSLLVENAVTEGCADLCEGVECGGGVCVELYPVGFCNCRGTGMLGASCTEDPPGFALALDGGSYVCYDIGQQPTSNEETTFSVTLTPPLPAHGTIMTGSSSSNLSYTLALENQRLVYSLMETSLSEYSTVNSSSTYKVDVGVNRTYTTIAVSELMGGVFVTVHHVETPLSSVRSVDPHFETVCLGGARLEESNYKGTIENAFVDYYSLNEERLFDRLKATWTCRLDVISILGTDSVEFQKSHFNATKIAFDLRIPMGSGGTIVGQLTNGLVDIGLSTFTNMLIIEPNHHMCTIDVEDQQWHHFEMLVQQDPSPSLTFTVDSQVCGSVPNFTEFLSSPLQFGVPILTGGGSLAAFSSCFRNFVFEYSDNRTLSPNLEALTRVRGSSFSSTGCSSATYSTCPTITTTPEPGSTTPTSDDTPTPDTTTRPPGTAPSPPPSISTLEAGVWVGIGIAIFIALLLILILIVLVIFFCWKGTSGRGFYRTHETDDKNPSVLHYSASLRQLTSEVVHQSNGQLPPAGSVQANGGHSSKEFYL